MWFFSMLWMSSMNKGVLSGVSLTLALALGGCGDGVKGSDGLSSQGSTEVTDIASICTPDNVSDCGMVLPYSVLRNDLENGAIPGSTFEIRNGGFGSDMDGHPTNPMQFYAITDRGPNANYTGEQGKGKVFPVPDYVPRIGLFEIQPSGDIHLVKTILLKDPEGNLISGLPNSAALGGTGETPYNAEGKVITVDPTRPYNSQTNPIKLDDHGLDSEGLVALGDGTFWVSDEYGLHLVHYNAEGVEISRINPFASDPRNIYSLPAEFGNRWANRGMEGLTITPDQQTLVGIMQSSLDNPAKHRSDLTRIVTVNLQTGKVAQYLYRQEQAQNSNSAIKALSATRFLVLERDGAFYHSNPDAMKHVYKIDISTATDLEAVTTAGVLKQDSVIGLTIEGKSLEQVIDANTQHADTSAGWQRLADHHIQPVNKVGLVADMVAEVAYPHDKMEGLWVIDGQRLGVINDDDFATWSSGDVLEQKYLDNSHSRIDGNTLYIVDGLDLSPQ